MFRIRRFDSHMNFSIALHIFPSECPSTEAPNDNSTGEVTGRPRCRITIPIVLFLREEKRRQSSKKCSIVSTSLQKEHVGEIARPALCMYKLRVGILHRNLVIATSVCLVLHHFLLQGNCRCWKSGDESRLVVSNVKARFLNLAAATNAVTGRRSRTGPAREAFAKVSATSFNIIPLCPGTQINRRFRKCCGLSTRNNLKVCDSAGVVKAEHNDNESVTIINEVMETGSLRSAKITAKNSAKNIGV